MVGDDTLFAKLAVRIGALAPEDVAEVRGEHDASTTSLEQALLARGLLEPELAQLVRAACDTAREEDWFPPRRSA
ncbi:MAG: hypothetical protein R3F62_05485 [Planctomycetota bacterium]